MTDINEKLYNLKKEIAVLEKHITETTMLPENKEHIFRFERHSLVSGERSVQRTLICLRMLRLFSMNCTKNLTDLTRDDVNDVMLKLKLKQKPPTINMIIGSLRVFYRYADNIENGEISPRTKHLKTKPSTKTLKREDLLSEEDINKMIQRVQTERNGMVFAAMFSLQFECALRPGELRGILLKNITKTEYGFKILTHGKTGDKTVYSVVSAPLIEKILSGNKFNNIPDAPLFYNVKNDKPEFIPHITYTRRVYRTSMKTIGKRCSPYCVRHSKITGWTLQGIPEAILKKLAGHSPTSKATSRYQHLINEDCEQVMLQIAGVKPKEEQKKEVFCLRPCPKCATNIAPYMQFCSNCGEVLDKSLAIMSGETAKAKEFEDLKSLAEFIDSTPNFLEMMKKMAAKGTE